MTSVPRPGAVDYTLPSISELKSVVAGPRIGKTRGGNYYRRWQPSAGRKRAVRLIVYTRDDFTCQLCGRKHERPQDYAGELIYGLTVDHIIPYAKGGLYYPDNLRAACESCNCRRGVGE